MIDVLTPIWERLLVRAPVGVDENFFDLGGDPSTAAKLFFEVARVTGREFPPLTIYQAPTISTLASLLEQPQKASFPALVLLRGGTGKPPIYIAHGLGSHVMDLFQLVKRLETGHAVYGLQARGIDGISAPFKSIEEKAQTYLEAILQIQPQGPYYLIGYSLGGLVMFEMAQRLLTKGQEVALLAMVDSYPHASRLPAGQRAVLATRLTRRRTRMAMRSVLRAVRASSKERAVPALEHGSHLPLLAPAMQLVRDRAYSALKKYKPRFYNGGVKFVRAEIGTTFPHDPAPVWSHLAAKFDCETVPGDHLGVLTTHVESLASVLNRFVRCAVTE